MKHPHSAPQRGFSLVEVLMAVVIFSVALVALARFMGGLMIAGSDAKARALAAALAQQKVEDLRQFSYPEAATGTTTTFGYADIQDNGGGTKLSGGTTLRIPSGAVSASSVAGSNVSYNIGWTETDYYYTGGGNPVLWTAGTGRPQYSDFKQVTVTVSWLDPSGVSQAVIVPAQISSVPPSSQARSGSPQLGRTSPVVYYTPQGAPEVISIPVDVGGGKKRETTKPLPEVNQQGQVLWVSFGTITYEDLGNNLYGSLVQEDFLTINCPCQLRSNLTSPSTAQQSIQYGVSRQLWNGSALENSLGKQLLKSYGETTVSSNDETYDLCQTCCSTHFDPDGSNVVVADSCDPNDNDPYDADGDRKLNCFDAHRPAADYRNDVSVDGGSAKILKHYHYSGGSWTEVTSPNSAYEDSCRMKRLDGVWRVFPDWHLAGFTTVQDSALGDAGILQSSYIDRVQGIVQHAIDNSGTLTPSDPLGTGTAQMANTTINLVAAQTTQAQSRAVFVDDMTADEISYLQNSSNFPNGQDDRLQYVPFYEINTALLSEWYPRCNLSGNAPRKNCSSPTTYTSGGYTVDPLVVTVLNQDIDQIQDSVLNYYGSYFRGVVQAASGVTAATTKLAWSDIHDANTGITGQTSVYPSYTVGSSSVPVAVTPASASVTFSGAINKGTGFNQKAQSHDVTVTLNSSSSTCTVSWTNSAGNGIYNCTAAAVTAQVVIGVQVSGFTVSPSSQTLTGPFATGATGIDFTYNQ